MGVERSIKTHICFISDLNKIWVMTFACQIIKIDRITLSASVKVYRKQRTTPVSSRFLFMQISAQAVVQVWWIRNETSLPGRIWSTVAWLICRTPSWHRFITPHTRMTHIWPTRAIAHDKRDSGGGSMTFSPPKIGHHTGQPTTLAVIRSTRKTIPQKQLRPTKPGEGITSHSLQSRFVWFNFGITFQRFVRHTQHR